MFKEDFTGPIQIMGLANKVKGINGPYDCFNGRKEDACSKRRENQKRAAFSRIAFSPWLRFLSKLRCRCVLGIRNKMPIYNIRGIDVDFPFEAYQCQIVYMDRVIESLQNVGYPRPLFTQLLFLFVLTRVPLSTVLWIDSTKINAALLYCFILVMVYSLKHTGKIPRIVKGDVVQGCSSRKAKVVELNDEETPVEKSCEVVDLECDNCERETFETQMSASGNCFNTMGLVKKRKVPESQGSAASSVLTAKGSGSGDYKEASASAFLNQAKEKLNTEEYKKFVGYMQALKKEKLKLANVMQSSVQLFCGRDRDHLLTGFRDFVPVKYCPAYEQCIR